MRLLGWVRMGLTSFFRPPSNQVAEQEAGHELNEKRRDAVAQVVELHKVLHKIALGQGSDTMADVNFCLLARHFANANHCLVTTIVNNNQVPRAVLDIISLALYGRASCYGSSL
ncbi:Os09g0462150 [Oryza sativa Japonica Group]|uniref:Os09g0462150 protein n=1 Tax=Oryza sativa subsp. japonica TaxID=39947 RepID=A0A0P0XNN1_ORYSJ|nr:Os09g0462150 [Oryza sativa Japonica Group]